MNQWKVTHGRQLLTNWATLATVQRCLADFGCPVILSPCDTITYLLALPLVLYGLTGGVRSLQSTQWSWKFNSRHYQDWECTDCAEEAWQIPWFKLDFLGHTNCPPCLMATFVIHDKRLCRFNNLTMTYGLTNCHHSLMAASIKPIWIHDESSLPSPPTPALAHPYMDAGS